MKTLIWLLHHQSFKGMVEVLTKHLWYFYLKYEQIKINLTYLAELKRFLKQSCKKLPNHPVVVLLVHALIRLRALFLNNDLTS